jgi:hypothetical protein
MLKAPNPDTSPDTAFLTPAGTPLQLEQALVENNRDFSSELLRLALAGIAVIGFIYDKIISKLPGFAQEYVGYSVICFGLAAAGALFHRFFNTTSLRCYVWGLRYREAKQANESNACLTVRANHLKAAGISKLCSAICLGAGALWLAVAFMRGLGTTPASSTQQPPPAPTFPSRIDVHVHDLQRSGADNANPPRQ